MVFPSILSIIVAFIAAMAIGFFWYSETGFGKEWMRLSGLTKADTEKDVGTSMMFGSIATLLTVIFLGVLMRMVGVTTLGGALTVGIIVALMCYVPVQLHQKAWEMRPKKLLWINGANQVITILVMSAILFWMS
jgi:hypothetical protein